MHDNVIKLNSCNLEIKVIKRKKKNILQILFLLLNTVNTMNLFIV